jgi:hypothetical protein
MKYANVDGQRREAAPGLRGICPICNAVMTPKCGKFRVAHWAHPPGSFDHRWEPETPWHRNWKGFFPAEWQEVEHRATNGERHVADVKTQHGLVLEFQNSPIRDEERRCREEFYRPMFWVVNGQRLKGDRSQFYKLLRLERIVSANPLTLVVPAEECLLLQKWAESRTQVFFDFGEAEEAGDLLRFGAPVLWASHPKRPIGKAVLRPVFRKSFIEAAMKGEPVRGIDFSKVFGQPLRPPAQRVILSSPYPWNPRPRKFKRYTRKRQAWSRSGMSAMSKWRRRWSRMG